MPSLKVSILVLEVVEMGFLSRLPLLKASDNAWRVVHAGAVSYRSQRNFRCVSSRFLRRGPSLCVCSAQGHLLGRETAVFLRDSTLLRGFKLLFDSSASQVLDECQFGLACESPTERGTTVRH